MRVSLVIPLALMIGCIGLLGANPPSFYSVAIDNLTQYPTSFDSSDLYVSGIYNISAPIDNADLITPIPDVFHLPLILDQSVKTITQGTSSGDDQSSVAPNLAFGTCSEVLPLNEINIPGTAKNANSDNGDNTNNVAANDITGTVSSNPNDESWYACLNGDKSNLDPRGFVGSSGLVGFGSGLFNLNELFGEGGFFSGALTAIASPPPSVTLTPPGTPGTGTTTPPPITPPTPIPEPATVLILSGVALLGVYLKSTRIHSEKP